MNPLIIELFDVPIGLSILNSGLILGLMAAPIITTIAEDALKAVPDQYREAAEAMGATRWQIVWKVVLPACQERSGRRHTAGSRSWLRRDHGGPDGQRSFHQSPHQRLRFRSGTDGNYRCRAWRNGCGFGPLPCPLHAGDPTVPGDLYVINLGADLLVRGTGKGTKLDTNVRGHRAQPAQPESPGKAADTVPDHDGHADRARGDHPGGPDPARSSRPLVQTSSSPFQKRE